MFGVWEKRTVDLETGADSIGFTRLTQSDKRHESNFHREVAILAEWEKLRRPNPMGGCGVKQSHKVRVGSNR